MQPVPDRFLGSPPDHTAPILSNRADISCEFSTPQSFESF
jgi:hypothetical protein